MLVLVWRLYSLGPNFKTSLLTSKSANVNHDLYVRKNVVNKLSDAELVRR